MPRIFEESIMGRQDLNDQQKDALRRRRKAFKIKARILLANNPSFTDSEKIELLIDFVVGGE